MGINTKNPLHFVWGLTQTIVFNPSYYYSYPSRAKLIALLRTFTNYGIINNITPLNDIPSCLFLTHPLSKLKSRSWVINNSSWVHWKWTFREYAKMTTGKVDWCLIFFFSEIKILVRLSVVGFICTIRYHHVHTKKRRKKCLWSDQSKVMSCVSHQLSGKIRRKREPLPISMVPIVLVKVWKNGSFFKFHRQYRVMLSNAVARAGKI